MRPFCPIFLRERTKSAVGKNPSSDFKKEHVHMHLQQNEEREREAHEDFAALLLDVSPNLLEGFGSRDFI